MDVKDTHIKLTFSEWNPVHRQVSSKSRKRQDPRRDIIRRESTPQPLVRWLGPLPVDQFSLWPPLRSQECLQGIPLHGRKAAPHHHLEEGYPNRQCLSLQVLIVRRRKGEQNRAEMQMACRYVTIPREGSSTRKDCLVRAICSALRT